MRRALDDLLSSVDVLAVGGRLEGLEVTGVTHDSRAVGPGGLFCCVPGHVTDGHAHAAAAVEAGAVALLCERFVDLGVAQVGVVQVKVPDVRAAMGPVAAAFWGHPSSSLDVVGVTGTNGKTTATLLLASVLEAAGRPTRVLGTLNQVRTTPEAPDLQASLAAGVEEGVTSVSMEVSSHALAQSRVDGTRFAVAVFTNLSRDHLDFHDSMEDYFAAKARLFDPGRTAVAVVNGDDPHGRLLRDAARVPTRAYSLDDVTGLEVGLTSSAGTWRGLPFRVPLGGAFNVSNALAAAGAALELGVDEATVVEGLAAAPPVPGRFEIVDAGQPFTVVVDYAHTPDGLSSLLAATKPGPGQRLFVVFGAGGDRDRGKRAGMGEAAARHADEVVLTSDNPRHEDPMRILAELRAGAVAAPVLVVEPDRGAAIALALGRAGPGDVVVVAGRGGEVTQIVGDAAIPFDDRAVAVDGLARLGWPGGAAPGGPVQADP